MNREEIMDNEIKIQPWEGLSTNLAIRAFLEDHKSKSKSISIAQVVKDFIAHKINLIDILKIIYFCSGSIIYVSKTRSENVILKNKLRGRISPDAYEKIFEWYKGKRLYIPTYQSVVKSYKNSLIFKALKRSNKLKNRQKLSKQYNIPMREIARIYRDGIAREKKKAYEKEAVELEKSLQK